MKKILTFTLLLVAGLLTAGCAPDFKEEKVPTTAAPSKFTACYGYGCIRKVNYAATPDIADRFAAIMKGASASPEAERAAISNAVKYYEDLSATRIGARDDPKSPIANSGKLGQMDCIDESTNTRHIMLYLQARGFFTYHRVQSNQSRGLLIDGRYPHWTAVLKQTNGDVWAVDSWYEPAGGAPDIVPISYWRTRGVMGER